jgi:hypothetical protein
LGRTICVVVTKQRPCLGIASEMPASWIAERDYGNEVLKVFVV